MYETDYYGTMYDVPGREAKKWAMACHLGGLARLTAIPFGGIAVPLIIWLLKRDEDPYIRDQGRESVNFQMTMSLYNLVAGVIVGILTWITFGFLGFLLWPLLPLIWLAEVGGCIYGAVQANSGKPFRYPATIRFLS